MSSKRLSPWPFLAAGLFLLPVLYVLSYGPVAWVGAHPHVHSHIPDPIVSLVVITYLPLAWVIGSDESPRWLHDGIIWYLSFWG